MRCSSCPAAGFLWSRESLTELAIVASLLGLGWGVEHGPYLVARPFLERDPALSAPLIPGTVSTGALFVICTVVPGVLILAAGLLRARVSGTWRWRVAEGVWWAWMGLAFALALSVVAYGISKQVVGQGRPSAFAMCNYAGYADALETKNFSAYLSATDPSRFGDWVRCRGPPDSVENAQQTFFSGHAALSFAGMLYLAFFLRRVARVPAWDAASPMSLATTGAPLVLATYVALTRVFDRRHRTEDICFGAIVGSVAGVLGWMHQASRPNRLSVLAPLEVPAAAATRTDATPARASAAVV